MIHTLKFAKKKLVDVPMSFLAHTDVHQTVADRSTDAAVNRSGFNLIK